MADIVIHPSTGEVLDLDASTEDLARWLVEARQLDEAMRAEKRRVVSELLARMDRDASYTLRVGDLELKGDGPAPPMEYDAVELRAALSEFVEAEVISSDALDRAIEDEQKLRPRVNGLKALMRQGGPLAETIERYAHPKEGHERRLSVRPASS
ncbi:MAG: hypothetical protein JWN10_930 [Solirubrobacterales bacterium]|nr:hypothetical protein [Solirubrobacterales bacterium]